MTIIRTFEDLSVYQKAMSLTESIYKTTSDGPFSKDWGLRDQLRRASVSIISNIAEGYERNSTLEYRRFLLIAKGSSGEVRAQLALARNLGYLSHEKADNLIESCVEVTRMLGGLAKKIQGTR
jgi:four helix bundle protein